MGYTNAALGRLAAKVRSELGLSDADPFDPHLWGREYGVLFLSLEEIEASKDAVAWFTRERPQLWSAALLRSGTGHVIVYNTAHADVRVRSNLTHEVAHLVAEHQLNSAWMDDDRCAGAGSSQEREAAELAGALLVPGPRAKAYSIRGRSALSVASEYEVSVEMATWRMGVSGGAIIAQRARLKSRTRAS